MKDMFEPLSNEELEWLDDFLLNRIDQEFYDEGVDEGVLNVSDLDGLLTAVVSGPVLVPPSQWLPQVWGDKHIGSSLEDFLEEEGLLESSQSVAIKRVLSWQITQVMKKQNLTKAAMAARMNTSRSALDRLLDPDNESVTLNTLQNAAHAVGAHLEMKLVFGDKAA